MTSFFVLVEETRTPILKFEKYFHFLKSFWTKLIFSQIKINYLEFSPSDSSWSTKLSNPDFLPLSCIPPPFATRRELFGLVSICSAVGSVAEPPPTAELEPPPPIPPPIAY